MKKMIAGAAILLVLILCITGCSSTKTEVLEKKLHSKAS